MINSLAIANPHSLRSAFNAASPFRHLVIEDFFDVAVADALLADFPVFDKKHAVNEFGTVGKKAFVTDLAKISPDYEKIYAYLNSAEFLGTVSRITGIDNLLADPAMFGGGTHENCDGQALAVHVDFNYSVDRKLHRRLNILVYLNHEWQQEWGGSIELHSNPRDPERDEYVTILPLFNRAVIFETNEYSWHGFREINLPEGKKHLSRKCLSIYLYTADRPAQEVVPEHGTFYVQEPLPDHFKSGHVLDAGDVRILQSLLKKRDDFIFHYQKMELERNGTIAALADYLKQVQSKIRLPLTGHVKQDGAAAGYWHDGWVSPDFAVSLIAVRPVTSLTLHVYIPDSLRKPFNVTFTAGEHRIPKTLGPGHHQIVLQPRTPLRDKFTLTLAVSEAEVKAADFEPGSSRMLVFLLRALEFNS